MEHETWKTLISFEIWFERGEFPILGRFLRRERGQFMSWFELDAPELESRRGSTVRLIGLQSLEERRTAFLHRHRTWLLFGFLEAGIWKTTDPFDQILADTCHKMRILQVHFIQKVVALVVNQSLACLPFASFTKGIQLSNRLHSEVSDQFLAHCSGLWDGIAEFLHQKQVEDRSDVSNHFS